MYSSIVSDIHGAHYRLFGNENNFHSDKNVRIFMTYFLNIRNIFDIEFFSGFIKFNYVV